MRHDITIVTEESSSVWSEVEFRKQLEAIGKNRYHSNHPFHKRMHQGTLSEYELRSWIINRFYYQINLPVKDSIILSKLQSREDRRIWINRIIDHDGPPFTNSQDRNSYGGIDAWLQLAKAAGIADETINDHDAVKPGAKFAVDAYVNYCRNQTWYEAVASSLTELFAPNLISKRIEVFEKHYPWIKPEGLLYFKNRLTQAPRDCDHALKLILKHGTTRDMQDKAVKALHFKCDVLWALLDAIDKQ